MRNYVTGQYKKHMKTHERKGQKVELPGFVCRARLAENLTQYTQLTGTQLSA